MPELPDVEVIKQKIDSTSLRKTINRVEVKDDQVLNVSAQTLRKYVESKQFETTQRLGKYILTDLGSDKWLAMHFGMTGNVGYQEKDEDYPKYARVVFHFSEDGILAYTTRRKLGSIDVIDDPGQFKQKKNLGEDALEVDYQSFQSLIKNKRSMIKTALMDQNMIAGIGNVYSDEILYQCKIHPETKTTELNEDQIRDLHNSMQRIFKTSINNKADADQMPDRYLISHRDESEDCPECGGKVKRIEVSGRGCYICPGCQQL